MVDAAPVEGIGMEKDLARSLPDQNDRVVPTSVVATLNDPDRWITIGRKSEMSFASVDRSPQRQQLKDYMEERAVILPPSHEFTQMARRVSERLGIPEDTEFLALDTEDFNAFFHPESRTVAFTRGFFRFFIEQGLDLSEDHVAAVLGHELEHAHVIGDNWLDKVKSSYLERALAEQNHAEEYRADAEAMTRLSRAGYNPRAVVELHKAMGLTHGRSDLGHPEQIDRVRKLEDRLADDEHPLSNTTKPLTPLGQELLSWFVQDSDIYNHTERLLHSSSAQLDQVLASAQTQPQFWEILQIKRHVDKVEAAKTLVDEEDQPIEQLAVKLMVLNAFTGKVEAFVEREPVSIDYKVNNSIGSERGGLSSDEDSKIFYPGYTFSEGYKVASLLQAQGFRDTVPASLEPGFSLESSKTNLEDVSKLVDKIIQARFNLLESMDLSEDEQRYFAQLKDCYENSNASEGLFLTLYPTLDLKLQTAKQEEAIRSSDERGRRRPDSTSTTLIDFQNPQERQRVLDQMKFAIAHHFIEVPDVSEVTIDKLSSTISHDTGLKEGESAIIASSMLRGESAKAWVDYLKQQDKDSLKEMIEKVQDIHDRFKRPLFSPLRKFHRSYQESSSPDNFNLPQFANGIEFGIDASGLSVIKMLAARELYLRGYPPNYNLDFTNHLPPAQINLTREEWDLAVKGVADHGIETERNEWALMKYIEQIQKGEALDPEVVEYAKKYGDVSYNTKLTAEQIQMMTKHSLWENEKLQQMVVQVLDNWFDTKKFPEGRPVVSFPDSKIADLSEQDRKEIQATLREAYVLFRNNPVDESKLRYGKKPDADEVASRLLDVLIQDRTVQGVSFKDASMQALRQISTEGVFLNYLEISKETKEAIIDFTEEEIQDLIQLLKSLNYEDAEKQDLIENFQLIALFPPSNRREVIEKPISEATIKAILEKHGNDSLDWVTQNFQSSDLRDIILIGLYEFATDEQAEQFYLSLQDRLTEHPDKFNAKNSALFPFELYYRDVKVDKDPADIYLGVGKLSQNFPDLLKRRHPFATLSFSAQAAAYSVYDRYSNPGRYGSIYQRYVATRLYQNEEGIFNNKSSLDERVQVLVSAAPHRSVVRDVHLEMLLEEGLINAVNDTEKVEAGRRLLPLFTEKSALKDTLAVQILHAEIGVNPHVMKDFNGFIDLLTHYIPEPSLARNYFLNQLEDNVPLTPNQLKQVSSMRVSSEGKRDENDSAPMTFVINRLGELNREERAKATLWLLGISSEKPKTILDIERNFDGHLDSLPKAVAVSTDDEKSVLFQRLLLGAEGIVDLEAVNPDQRETALQQQREFIKVFSENLLPDSMPRADLFRGVFATIIESSDPSHSSRILIKLINRFTELQVQGETLPPEEVVAIGLNELGVVGKKVAQSLAELDWVPDSYKKTLRKSQSEGEVVPKRALMVFAENMGLLDESAPIRILSFDELIGAASNKQACLLTVEVNDESVGLPKGKHQVVGKFKRPSAQKIENLDHDLRVVRNITDSLAQQGYTEALPKDFSAQISDAVRRELDFEQEKQFSVDIKADLERRNLRRKHKVKVPTIFLASDDVLLESKAEGISLRDYYDLKENPAYPLILFKFGMERTFTTEINRTLLEESLAELVSTGNIHADLHPGNVFVDPQSDLTLIDLGMHERLTTEQRIDTVSLVAGLITGNETFVKRVLSNLGWNIGDADLGLKRLDLAQNATQLLKAIQQSETRAPEILSSIILATSKLTNYAADFSNGELFRMLAGSVNPRELPTVVLRLIQSGGRELLR